MMKVNSYHQKAKQENCARTQRAIWKRMFVLVESYVICTFTNL